MAKWCYINVSQVVLLSRMSVSLFGIGQVCIFFFEDTMSIKCYRTIVVTHLRNIGNVYNIAPLSCLRKTYNRASIVVYVHMISGEVVMFASRTASLHFT